MKPKTKLQMEIVNGSRKLAPVSEAQKRYAYKHCFVHYFKRDAKGNCFCLDCGHTWRDKEDKKNCKCPHCGMNLKLENSRKRTAVYKEYFCVITTYKQYQVIRFFMVDCRLKKGSPANYFIIEAVQCWMNKEGKTETLSLLRGMSIFYYDAWIYGSSLELRKRNVHHDRIYDICPAVIYPRMKVIPELTRNGFKGVFYDICPSSFFMTLLTDNRMEILYKAGQMNLFLRFLERKYGMDKYWTYVKICLRHDYVIHDADLWLDYVDMLIENKLDARNPHYLCPLNVEEAHDWVMGKCKKKYSNGEDIGFVGDITEVNPKILYDLLEKDFLPIVFPIGFDDNYDSYNINADDAACAIAEAVHAEKLAFLSDIEGVYRDKDCLLYTSPSPRDVEESRMPSSA